MINPINSDFPLLLAAQNGHESIIALLLAAKSDPNMFDPNDGASPLGLAAQHGHGGIVDLLLAAGADPRMFDPRSSVSPLRLAVQWGHESIASRLLAAAPHPDGNLLLRRARANRAQAILQHVTTIQSIPLPGVWTADKPRTRDVEVLAALLESGAPSGFQGPVEIIFADTYLLVSDDDLNARRVRFVSKTNAKLTFEMAYLTGRRLPAVFLKPGLKLDALMRSLNTLEILPELRDPRMKEFMAAAFLLTRATPLIPVPATAPLCVQAGETVPLISYADKTWRPWRAQPSPEGPVVELPWIDGPTLRWGSVLVPGDGLGMRILKEPKVLVRNARWTADQFARDAQGRITGLWIRGDTDRQP